MVLGFTACSDSTNSESFHKMVPGTYLQSAEGFAGTYTVWVTVSETVITDIRLDGFNDTAGVGAEAMPIMLEKIRTAQTVNVDSVSGATVTSNSIKEAVKAALEQAGAPSSFTTGTPVVPATKPQKTITTNVIIIGSGIAGLSAAVSAKTETPAAGVIVIEKQEIIGGTTKTSAGVVYAALDATQQEADNLKNYYMMRAQGQADEAMVKFFADNSYATLGFLDIDGSNPYGGMATGTATEARCRFGPGGLGIIQNLYKKAADAGVTVMTGVKATELITNDAGAVIGVKAESKDINYTFNVDTVGNPGYLPYVPATPGFGGVIIAAGGFDSDREGLMAQYNPDSMYDIPQSNHGNVGEGIKMAIAIGADTVFKGGKVGWVGVDYSITGSHYYSQVIHGDGAKSGELLDLSPPEGVTYATHPDDYAVVHRAMLDARTKDGTTKFWALSNTPPDAGYAAKEWAFTDNTAAGLAAKISVDADKLAASFTAGGYAGAIGNTAPFTATKAVPSSIGSMGGLKINTNGQVLKNDVPIEGLYAAGESANGQFFYKEYPASGSSLAVSATFGRMAGKHAATNTY
jgi:fumarate reductase flavoprotein subunit